MRLSGSYSLYRFVILLVSFALFGLTPGCSRPENRTLVLPVVSGGASLPSYIEYIDSAVIDSTRLALTWVDGSAAGPDRVWMVELRANSTGLLEAVDPPSLIDTGGNISDAHVFADGDSFGLIYAKNSQLLCCRPWGTAARFPFAPSRPLPIASAAYVGRDSTLFIVALTLQSRGEEVEKRWVALAIKNDSTQSKLLGLTRWPRVRQQPTPQLYPVGDSLGVALFLNWGSFSNAASPSDSVGRADGEAGAFALFRVYTDSGGALEATQVAAATLANSDVRLARDFALLDQQGALLAANATRTYLIAPFASGNAPQRLSSPLGSSVNYSRPHVQSLQLKDGSQLLLWTDAADGISASDIANNRVASQFGADIHAVRIVEGHVDTLAVRGFPIRTNAQCITLNRLGTAPVLAWARASNSWRKGALVLDGICVRKLPTMD